MDTDYKPATFTRTDSVSTHVAFGVKDSKGREVGARTTCYVETVTDRTDGQKWGSICKPEDFGVWFCFEPHATRDGKSFGAIPVAARKKFRTAAERDAHVPKYLAAAQKRAAKVKT